MRAYLQAGIDREALKAAVQSAADSLMGDAELSLLAANIAEPLEDREHALAWLEESSRSSPDNLMLLERIVRLQVSMGRAERKRCARRTAAGSPWYRAAIVIG